MATSRSILLLGSFSSRSVLPSLQRVWQSSHSLATLCNDGSLPNPTYTDPRQIPPTVRPSAIVVDSQVPCLQALVGRVGSRFQNPLIDWVIPGPLSTATILRAQVNGKVHRVVRTAPFNQTGPTAFLTQEKGLLCKMVGELFDFCTTTSLHFTEAELPCLTISTTRGPLIVPDGYSRLLMIAAEHRISSQLAPLYVRRILVDRQLLLPKALLWTTDYSSIPLEEIKVAKMAAALDELFLTEYYRISS